MNNNQGITFWMSGLPSSGKTTLAKVASNVTGVVHLDSDEIRESIIPTPTYTTDEKRLIYRCLAHFSAILNNNKINVIVSATSNLREYRNYAKENISNYREVYIRCAIDVCEQRDVKGLYYRSRMGEISTIPMMIMNCNEDYVKSKYKQTGLFEEPERPDIIIDTSSESLQICCDNLSSYIFSQIKK